LQHTVLEKRDCSNIPGDGDRM